MPSLANLNVWCKFDEGSGTNAADASGKNHPGTLNGGAGWTASSKWGGAGDFALTTPGNDSGYVSFGDHADFQPSSALTVAFWVYPLSWGTDLMAMVSKQSDTPSFYPSWELRKETGTARLQAAIATSTPASFTAISPTDITTAQWQHIALVWGSNSLRVLRNGIPGTPVATTGTLTANTIALTIGRNPAFSGRSLDARFDDFRLYARELTAAEIVELMQYRGANYLELYCDPQAGDQTNSGSTEAAPLYTEINGDWDNTAKNFGSTGSPNMSVIPVGEIAAIRPDGASVATLVGRISAVDNVAKTISLDSTTIVGSQTDLSASASIKIGGPWKGPSGTDRFPLHTISSSLRNASGDFPRINLHNGATYAITTSSIAPNLVGPVTVQGYASVPGDKGQALIDGGTGASYTIINPGTTADRWILADIKVNSSFTSGSNANINLAAGVDFWVLLRVVSSNARLYGFNMAGEGLRFIECLSEGAGQAGGFVAGFYDPSGNNNMFLRCRSRTTAGASGHGFYIHRGTLLRCVADGNGFHGFTFDVSFRESRGFQLDSYNNAGSGVFISHTSNNCNLILENVNVVKNGGWGISGNTSGTAGAVGLIRGVRFGTGTQANTSGKINLATLKQLLVEDEAELPANITPWKDPAAGDFTLTRWQSFNGSVGDFPPGSLFKSFGSISAAEPKDLLTTRLIGSPLIGSHT